MPGSILEIGRIEERNQDLLFGGFRVQGLGCGIEVLASRWGETLVFGTGTEHRDSFGLQSRDVGGHFRGSFLVPCTRPSPNQYTNIS